MCIRDSDSASYSKNNFSLIDSTSNMIIPLEYSYQSKSKKEEFVLGLTDSLKAENIYYLRAERLKDLIGNVFEDELTSIAAVSYTHLRAHETVLDLVCRLLLEKKTTNIKHYTVDTNQFK